MQGLLSVVVIAVAFVPGSTLDAQSYPSKPIRTSLRA